jgi:hypothetical protein
VAVKAAAEAEVRGPGAWGGVGIILRIYKIGSCHQGACKDPDTSPPAPFPHHHPAHRHVHSPAGLCLVTVECVLDVADDRLAPTDIRGHSTLNSVLDSCRSTRSSASSAPIAQDLGTSRVFEEDTVVFDQQGNIIAVL